MSDTQAAYQAFLYFLSYNRNKTISAEHAGLSLADIRSHQLEAPDFARAMEEAVDAAAYEAEKSLWTTQVPSRSSEISNMFRQSALTWSDKGQLAE